MKLFLFLALVLNFAYAEDEISKCIGGGPGIKCGSHASPSTPPGGNGNCKEKCSKVEGDDNKKACYKKCAGVSHKSKKPKPGLCKDKCAGLENAADKKMCLKKCQKHKKKLKALAGCEKEDSQTISCPDGLYIKSSKVNMSDMVKEIEEKVPKIEKSKSESSKQ